MFYFPTVRHVESEVLDQGSNPCRFNGSMSLNHWATREVPRSVNHFFNPKILN